MIDNNDINPIDPSINPESRFPDSFIAKIVNSTRSLGAHDCILREGGDGWCVIDGNLHYFERDGKRRKMPFNKKDVQEMLEYIYEDLDTILTEYEGAATVRIPLPSGPTRVQIARDSKGYSLTFRMLPKRPMTIEEVGAPIWLTDFFAHAQRGLIVICGDVGNGKSSLWQMVIEHIYAQQMRQIITLESPIEVSCESPLIRQYQIDTNTTESINDAFNKSTMPKNHSQMIKTYEAGLRHRLRCNANVLVLGEILDPKTVIALLSAAESGALVIVTLHALRTVDVIDRLLSMLPADRSKIAQVQLAETLVGVIGTRLIPKREGGRILALELLRNTRTVKRMILDGDTNRILQDIENNGNDPQNGHLRLENMLKSMISQNIVTVNEAKKAANDPSAL